MIWTGMNLLDAQHRAGQAEVLARVDLAVVDQHGIRFSMFQDGLGKSGFDGWQTLIRKGFEMADEARVVVEPADNFGGDFFASADHSRPV